MLPADITQCKQRDHSRAAPVVAAAVAAAQAEDKWISRTIATADAAEVPESLSALRSSCSQALSTMRMPTTRNEEYR